MGVLKEFSIVLVFGVAFLALLSNAQMIVPRQFQAPMQGPVFPGRPQRPRQNHQQFLIPMTIPGFAGRPQGQMQQPPPFEIPMKIPGFGGRPQGQMAHPPQFQAPAEYPQSLPDPQILIPLMQGL